MSTGGDALLALAVRGGVGELADASLLRGTARAVYEACARDATWEEVVGVLLRAGAGSRERAERDARRFLGELRAKGLCSVAAPAAATTGGEGGAREAVGRESAELAADDVESLARAVLAGGHRLRFRARGRSMRPLIPDGATLDVEPRPFDAVRRGEVILYTAGERRLVAHRAVGRRGGGRRGAALLARGDGAARLDEVGREDFLGVVARCRPASGEWRAVSSGWRRAAGLAAGVLHRGAAAAARTLVLRPLAATYGSRSRVRAALRLALRLVTGGLRRLEGLSAAARRPMDVGRAALLSTEEKDEERRRLYRRRTVQSFTSLDENVEAGLTLIEEVLLARHGIEPGRALVLGCGPGRECFALARRGFEVTGLDREPGLLERARALAAERGCELSLVEGEAHDFHVEGPPFDVVVVFSGLYDMVVPRARRVSLLACARRHLRPGGRVLVTFLSAYVPPGQSVPPVRAKTFLEALNPEHEEGDLFLLNEAVHVFPRGEDVAAEAREAGLEPEVVYRDQRAYSRAEGRVKSYAVLRRGE